MSRRSTRRPDADGLNPPHGASSASAAGAAGDPGTSVAGAVGDPGTGPHAEPEQVARRICLDQLDRAPRTRAQLADTMQRRFVPDEVAARVLDRLEEVGLVDDAAFAAAWVRSRHATRGLSGRALARELRGRGIAAETIAAAVGELDDDTELDTARDLVRRKLRSMRSVPVEARRRRLVSLLGRKGYPAAVAYRVVRELVESDALSAEMPDTQGE